MLNLTSKPLGVLRLHLWERLKNGDYQSGNCRVCYQPKQDQWLVFVKEGEEWVNKRPVSRPWGYGHAGQAKIGAAHMARAAATKQLGRSKK